MRYHRTTGLDLSQMQELVRRVSLALTVPWNRKTGRPKSCGLYAAAETACMYIQAPKTPASVRTVHLPPFLANELHAHRERNPDTRFVFTGRDTRWHRRSNFRRRVWIPALTGDPKQGWATINPELHFHDLRHTQKTWLIEDHVPRVLQLQRLGHKPKDASDIYSHVTPVMIETMLAALQTRWDQYSTWAWSAVDESPAA